jgi:lipoprotein-anchoring transpeptidase ErfK/SrfK
VKVKSTAVGVIGALLVAGCSAAGSGTSAPTPSGPSAPVTSAARTSAPADPSPTATATLVARPAQPARTPCTTNDRPQLVFVSLKRQHLWMCARHRVVRETAITSGMLGEYTETPTGSYEIQGLNRNSVLTLNTGQTYPVKYWIPFDAPLFGFHDSSWQDFPYGSPKYATRGSHGCVHVPLAAIRFLYGWAQIGTAVRIKA